MSDNDLLKHVMDLARCISESAQKLQAHPEGKQAFDAWVEDFDFQDAFSTRWKDVGDDIGALMVLNQCYFNVLTPENCDLAQLHGKLFVEASYSTYIWWNGKWEVEDDLLETFEESTETV